MCNRKGHVATVVCCLVLHATVCWAQSVGEEKKSHDDFLVTQGIGIGLTGIRSFSSFSLTDSSGVKYDTMSLLMNDAARKMVGIPHDKYLELAKEYGKTTARMKSLIVNSAFLDEQKEILRSKFTELETSLQSKLTDEQLDSLERSRFLVGLEQKGIEYLATDPAAAHFGISKTDARTLADSEEQLKEFGKSAYRDQLKQANQELLETITLEQQKRIEKLLGDEGMQKLLKAKLFLGRTENKQSQNNTSRQMLKKLCSRTIRKKLGLSPSQDEEIRLIRVRQNEVSNEQLTDLIEDVLSTDQLETLMQRILVHELNELGTVAMLGRGSGAQFLELTDDESNEVCDAGKRIQAELTEKLRSRMANELNRIWSKGESKQPVSAFSSLFVNHLLSDDE